MKAVKALAVGLGHVLAVLACVVVSVALHLNAKVLRVAAVETVNTYVSSLMRGTLVIHEIESLHLGGITVAGVHLNDPNGERVIEGARVYLVPDIPFALGGGLRFSHARLEGGHVRLIEGADGLPSFLEAFESTDPDSPPSAEPFHAVVDDMRLSGLSVEGSLLGIEGLRIEELSAHGRMEFEEEMVISVFDADGRIVAPWPFEAKLQDLTTRITSDPFEGTSLHATVMQGEGAERDEVGVNLRYAVPEGGAPDGESELDILLGARPLHLERLGELGFGWADTLQGEARGHMRFTGPGDDLEVRGYFDTAGGEVSLRGRIPSEGDVVIDASTPGLNIGAVVVGAPVLTLAGDASLRAGETTTFEANLEPFDFAGTPVPATRVRGAIEEAGARIESAEIETPGGSLVLSGDVDFDGNLEFDAQGDVGLIQRQPLLAELVPGATGRLTVDGTVRIAADGRLDTRARFVVTNFRYGPVFVRRFAASGRVDGTLDAPVVRLALDAAGTRVSDVPLGNGSGRIAGGPRAYQTSMAFNNGDSRLRFASDLRVTSGGVSLSVPTLALQGYGQDWQGAIARVEARSAGARVEGFRLEDGESAIEGAFDWRFRRGTEDEGSLLLEGVRLQDLVRWLPDSPALAGTVNMEARFSGDFESQPDIVVEGQVAELGAFGLEAMEADFIATHQDRQIAVDGQLTSETRGEVDVSVSGVLDEGVPLLDAWREGSYEGRVRASDLDLAILNALGVETEVAGRASGQLELSGAYGIFDFDGRFDAPRFRVADGPTLGVRSHVSYDSGSFIVRALTLDDAGELLEGEVSVLFDLSSALEEPSLIVPMLEVAPWRASFRMAPRDLVTLPEVLSSQLPYASSLRASATMTVRGGAFRPVADVIADVEWIGETGSAGCGRGGIPRMAVRGSLRDGRAHLEARGLVRSEPVLFISADALAPVDEWVAGRGEAEVPATDFSVYLQNVPLHDVPVACEYVGGPLNVVLQAQDVFTPRMRSFLDVAGDELYIRRVETQVVDGAPQTSEAVRSPPFRVRMENRVSNGNARLELTSRWWNGGTLFIEGEAPLRMDVPGALPSFEEGSALSARANLEGTPLEAALFWLPGFGNIAGVTDGEVLLGGPAEDLRLNGAIDLRHGEVVLQALGQRLEDLEGTFLFEDGNITLQNVFASDGDGSLRIAGDIGVENLVPSSLQLALAATEFPVRQEGNVIASLTGDATFNARLNSEGLRGDLAVQSLNVELPEEEGRSPIGLEPHPEITVVGAAEAAPVERPFELRLSVDGSREFSLRGEDLAADLTADLEVTYRDPEFRVAGGVEVLGGNFEVFGRRFDVEQGWLRFGGETELDPAVNLVAVHNLRSRPGETVTVTAGGRLSDPDIRFSSSVTADRGEIIALLVSGNVRQGTAEQADRETLDFLTNVLSGALTLTLREELGAYIPNVTIQANDQGGSRYGGGWNIEQLLPESVRDILLGFYVEGFVSTQDQGGGDSTSQVPEVGVRIELDFPRSVQTSGTFSQFGWSTDVTWTP